MGQPLTREVQSEQAEAGEFINSLTGEGLGSEIGFIVAYYQQGRFAADQDSGKSYVAFGKTIPEQWADFVGEEWVGKPFDEYPDAEEDYKRRVNDKSDPQEWGRGPGVSTTHNFTGYAIASGLEEEGDEDTLIPVRLSLKRIDTPAAKKIISLKKMLRLSAFWDQVFDLSTERKTFSRGSSYAVNVKAGRKTTAEERLIAVTLAQDVAAQRVLSAGDDGDAKPEVPSTPAGALEV